ncbi:cytochrome P450 [Aspergillus pseudoustus]|uniref:Cytochrome P450 n=1 Tax=Aspergillus pseudoustus TaxID=1810923 RepID=A0ABR4IX55_9EURO
MALHSALRNLDISSWSTSELAFRGFLLILVVLLAKLGISVYRIYLHPLSCFHGLPAVCISENWLYKTTWSGTAEETFEALHEKYKTKALRIAPNELHITDIELYKVIYSQTKPFLKHDKFYDAFNTPHTVFAETDSALHMERRRLLSPLFSKVGVYKLEPVIRDKVLALADKVERLMRSLMTTDIITEFAFSKSANLIDESPTDMDSWFLEAFDVGSQSIVEMQYRLILRLAARFLPSWAIMLLSAKVGTILRLQMFARDCMERWQAQDQDESESSLPVVFDSLRSLSDEAKVSEAMDILIAGADTTASTLTTAIYHILRNLDIKTRLVKELDDASLLAKQMPSLQALEGLECLGACVKESIRVGMAVPGRLPRVVPAGEPFIVEGKVVPPGTIVGMSTYTMHNSVEAWGPDARDFNPSRWIGPHSKSLEQWLCTFSKGARMCLGQNVAPAEITLALAYFFRNYEMTLASQQAAPKALDRFTLQYERPGLPVMFRPRVGKGD